MRNQNNQTLTCQQCHKWKAEEDLLITSQGSFCEDCFADQ